MGVDIKFPLRLKQAVYYDYVQRLAHKVVLHFHEVTGELAFDAISEEAELRWDYSLEQNLVTVRPLLSPTGSFAYPLDSECSL